MQDFKYWLEDLRWEDILTIMVMGVLEISLLGVVLCAILL